MRCRHGACHHLNMAWARGLREWPAHSRATGIGCFFDDPVHEILGLDGHAFQSLYHFTVGRPVLDQRLTTLPAYTDDRV